MSSLLSLNVRKKEQKKKKKTTKGKSVPLLAKSLLSELKSIEIPYTIEEKQSLLLSLKETLIAIDNAVQLLIKKKQYYSEIVSSLETEIAKRNQMALKEEHNKDNIMTIKEELYSM